MKTETTKKVNKKMIFIIGGIVFGVAIIFLSFFVGTSKIRFDKWKMGRVRRMR